MGTGRVIIGAAEHVWRQWGRVRVSVSASVRR